MALLYVFPFGGCIEKALEKAAPEDTFVGFRNHDQWQGQGGNYISELDEEETTGQHARRNESTKPQTHQVAGCRGERFANRGKDSFVGKPGVGYLLSDSLKHSTSKEKRGRAQAGLSMLMFRSKTCFPAAKSSSTFFAKVLSRCL